jgi:hypothetical protein
MVAIISLWPSTSSSEVGRYFSTLQEISNWFPRPIRALYQGSESSASTGRFAALRLPFFWSPPKLMELSATGASTSISSSKSDMVGDVGVEWGVVEFSDVLLFVLDAHSGELSKKAQSCVRRVRPSRRWTR